MRALTLALLFAALATAQAQTRYFQITETLSPTNSHSWGGGYYASATRTFEVTAGQKLKFLGVWPKPEMGPYSATVGVTFPNQLASWPITNSPDCTVVGPCTIKLSSTFSYFTGTSTNDPNFVYAYCFEATGGPESTPALATVVPAGIPARVTVETTTDLINWSPALLGTVETNAANRFFRLKAELSPK